MKKGLLTLLAASLVFVGCQNYDDQFDDLNAQISALKSQVDGLSSLTGQVSALSGTIAGLQAGVSAAQASADAANTAASGIDLSGLSASLATLQAEVDAVQASLATAATASAVTALQVELDALESDLDDLLVSNNVYSTAITINSAASMANALALGNKVALMNEAVTITDNTTISDTDIQTFVNRIKTMNGKLTYSSGTATGFTPTFNELVSATEIELTVAGDISFTKLASATSIDIHDDFETKITSVDLGALTSVTTLTTDENGSDVDDVVRLNSVTNLDLGALTRYGTGLTIDVKKGATLDIASLDDTTTIGAVVGTTYALNITGPSSVSLSKIDDGTITLTNVATATVSNFYGTLDIKTGVENLTTTKTVLIDLDSASDLETATLDFATDYDPELSTANAAIAAKGYSASYTGSLGDTNFNAASLKTLTITGTLLDLYVSSAEGNLETLSIDATMDDLTIDGASDLTSLTVSSTSKIHDVTINNTTNLLVADLDHSFNGASNGSTAATYSTVSVVDNSALTTFHIAADKVGSLTVTGNDAMTSIDFTGLATLGGATEPVVNIYDNDLTATRATNTSDGDTNVADAKSGDLGSFDAGTSGMDTAYTYLKAAAADADTDGYVSFDTVSTSVDTETSGVTATDLNVTFVDNTTLNDATILWLEEQVATGGGSASKAKRSFTFDVSAATDVQIWAAGSAIFDQNADGVPAAIAVDDAITAGSTITDLKNLLGSATNVARAAAQGVTFSVSEGGNSTAVIEIGTALVSTVWETSNATASNINTNASDTITLTVGNDTVTVAAPVITSSSAAAGAVGSTAVTVGYTKTLAVANAIKTAWDAAVTASPTLFEFGAITIASSTLVALDGVKMTMAALDKGTGGADQTISLSISDALADSTAGASKYAVLPYAIGGTASTADNVSSGPDLVLTFEETESGVAANSIGLPSTSAASETFGIDTVSYSAEAASVVLLHSNYTPNATTGKATSTDSHPDESWSDITYPENTVSATVSNAAVSLSRVEWLD